MGKSDTDKVWINLGPCEVCDCRITELAVSKQNPLSNTEYRGVDCIRLKFRFRGKEERLYGGNFLLKTDSLLFPSCIWGELLIISLFCIVMTDHNPYGSHNNSMKSPSSGFYLSTQPYHVKGRIERLSISICTGLCGGWRDTERRGCWTRRTE